MSRFIHAPHDSQSKKKFSSHRYYTESVVDGLLRKYFGTNEMPYLGDLAKTTSVMLVNTHYSLNGVRPNTPAVIEVGGLHIREPKKLDSVSTC